ncbi:MAG: PEGA domain-containing protein [Patescibacteria group bacterium]|nr:PEGA domain-containing protein [Patescibacteria group bacterium]MBU1953203.1 PEGA domain-containing protein [Patescibacteria group bacterium]
MAVSTIRTNKNSFSTALIYFLGILGIALIVFFAGGLITGGFGGRAALSVQVTNDTAQVLLNGKVLGDTPLESKNVKSGTNTIIVKSDTQQYQTSIKFLPAKKDVSFAVGIVRDLGVSDLFSSGQEFWFDKGSPQDTLKIISEPSGATVYIDGSEIGKTPFSSSAITTGDYEIKIALAGYETQIARISIQKGYTLNGSIKMFPYPISPTVTAFEGSPNLYNGTLDNLNVTSDTQSWVKGLLYWNQTRGINIDNVGLNKEKVFDYYIDYKGNIFDADGTILATAQTLEKLKGAKRGLYLGRTSDGIGLTKEAKDALETLSQIGLSSKTATVKDTGTGWLRVRSIGGLNGTEIARVTSGATYQVLELGTGWVKIKVSDTIEGWVSADYVTLSE